VQAAVQAGEHSERNSERNFGKIPGTRNPLAITDAELVNIGQFVK
jgi:hypothetical protein